MGAMALMPFVGETDDDITLQSIRIAPHSNRYRISRLLLGGALFPTWPMGCTRTAFSGMSWALLLVLFALFLRPVGFDYRSKLDNTKWRTSGIGAYVWWRVPALVFGVAFVMCFWVCHLHWMKLYAQLTQVVLCATQPICVGVWLSEPLYVGGAQG